MIDLKNTVLTKLKTIPNSTFLELLTPVFVEEEHIISTFESGEAYAVFTTVRVIIIAKPRGKSDKKHISFFPYRKVLAYSIETAQFLDLDSELELSFVNFGSVKFGLENRSDISTICKCIDSYIL